MTKQLASLLFYNETLYTTPKEEAVEEVAKPSKVLFNKSVVFFTKPLSKDEHELLSKILSAIKLSIQDIEIHNDPELLKLIKEAHKVDKIVIFGDFLEATKLPEKYKIIKSGKQQYIFADAMVAVKTNANNEKANLWEALKVLFL